MEGFTPNLKSLYAFGSRVVKTIPIEVTAEEREIYLDAEMCVKEKLSDIKLSDKVEETLNDNQRLEKEKLKKERFQNLELSIAVGEKKVQGNCCCVLMPIL